MSMLEVDTYLCWKVYYSDDKVGWRVTYSKFGQIRYERVFNTEDEALAYISERKQKDPILLKEQGE
jgi:hypothetical protein